MALVIESTQTASVSAVGTITITKPTGLAVGDLLFAVVCVTSSAHTGSPTVTLPAGWTNGQYHQDVTGASSRLMYKIADSSDVSASDFSFTIASDPTLHSLGALFRISGAASPNIVSGTANAETNSAGDPTAISLSPTFTPNTSPTLLIMALIASDQSGANNGAIATPTSSPSLTWTELADYNAATTVAMSISYATHSSLSQFVSVTAALASGNQFARHGAAVVAVRPNQPDSGTSALLSADADHFAPVGSAGTAGTSALLSADADHFAPTAKGTSPSQWTPESKPSTTWTPESK